MNILKKLLYILFLLPGVALFAQKKNIKDLEQRLVILNYPDSTVKCEIMITPKEVETSNELEYFWYYTDELKSNIGGYSGYLLHGKYNVFDLHNNLIEEGLFSNGLRNGVWKRWTIEGKLIQHTEWENGQLNGALIIYMANGKKQLHEEYENGLKHGKQIIYKDTTKQISYFKKGAITEEKSFFNSKNKKDKKNRKRKTKEKSKEENKTPEIVETEEN